MPRFAAPALLTLVGWTWAAPVPPSRVWSTGWDRPLCPEGCRLDRDGEKLTLTIPGEGYGLDVENGRLNAPRLLRDVEGDFVVVVRIGAFEAPTGQGENAYRRAGLILTDGERVTTFQRTANLDRGKENRYLWRGSNRLGKPSGLNQWTAGVPLDKPAYLRLERQGDMYYASTSLDGKEWKPTDGGWGLTFPRKLKVGVVAEATAPGQFKVAFDQFKLSRPGE
jgi:regulation of enolase protein 1 (concanavalin A-like superfamily)